LTTDDDVELAAAMRHARETVVPIAAGRRCIDGRYEPGQGSGMIARPGADFGYVMALLAVNHAMGWGLTPVRLVDAVCDAVARDGDRFWMHTDQDAPWPSGTGPAGPTAGGAGPTAIGCRHVSASLDPVLAPGFFPPSYAEPDADVRAALARVWDRAAAGDRVGW
jgi:hypothetical protein